MKENVRENYNTKACLNDPILDPEKRVWMVRRKPGRRPAPFPWPAFICSTAGAGSRGSTTGRSAATSRRPRKCS